MDTGTTVTPQNVQGIYLKGFCVPLFWRIGTHRIRGFSKPFDIYDIYTRVMIQKFGEDNIHVKTLL